MAASMDNKISDDRRNREGPDNNGADVPMRRGLMTDIERKLIEKIRNSADPEAMMNSIEELLFNPQKFQEALKMLSAPLEI